MIQVRQPKTLAWASGRAVSSSSVSGLRTADLAMRSQGPHDDNPGGLKGSTQHWLAVYPPEFEIPTFFVAVD